MKDGSLLGALKAQLKHLTLAGSNQLQRHHHLNAHQLSLARNVQDPALALPGRFHPW